MRSPRSSAGTTLIGYPYFCRFSTTVGRSESGEISLTHLARRVEPVATTKRPLIGFSRARFRESGHTFYNERLLITRDLLPARINDAFVSDTQSSFGDYQRSNCLALFFVRDTDYRDDSHTMNTGDDALHLCRIDIESA
ncbi:hypothetical protein [Caballeronia sp. KNU42]